MSFLDFQAIKNAVSFEDTRSYLDLAMKRSAPNQFRGVCPTCEGNDRGLVITEDKGYYCFSDGKGGDVIALAAHVKGISVKEAAQFLAEMSGIIQTTKVQGTRRVTEPESEEAKDRKSSPVEGMRPLQHLQHDHEAVIAIGLNPEACEAHGIGYTNKGVCRGSVAIPYRDENGALICYFAVQELTYIPPEFQSNIVPLKKRA